MNTHHNAIAQRHKLRVVGLVLAHRRFACLDHQRTGAQACAFKRGREEKRKEGRKREKKEEREGNEGEKRQAVSLEEIEREERERGCVHVKSLVGRRRKRDIV